MPTKLQRTHAYTQTRTFEEKDVGRNSQGTETIPGGYRAGGRTQHSATPPQQDTEIVDRLRLQSRTPPVHQKILPWVSAVQTEGYQPPEGMFGPYDSQPPTRVQSIHDSVEPIIPRSTHPFAYATGSALPFAALANSPDGHPRHRPESEVLSRGAGMKVFSRPKDATPGAGMVGGGAGQDTPPTDISPGMGTFGMQPSQENLTQASRTAARKPVPPLGTQPPSGPLPAVPDVPPPQSVTGATPAVIDQIPPIPHSGPHIHHAHPEYPFNPLEAARKQEEAMEQARAEALATLEKATEHKPTPAPVPGLATKGPRLTYDTTTSGPSFGHIYHENGVPMSRHISMQDPPMPLPIPVPQPPEPRGPGRASFFRIPFGVPMGVSFPRPLLVSRDSAGLGVGVGLPSRIAEFINPSPLSRVAESPENRQRKDDRSAYVETVHDEEEPVDPTVSARQARSGAPSRESAALAESGIHPTGTHVNGTVPAAAPSHHGTTVARSAVPQEPSPPISATTEAPPPPPPKSPTVRTQIRHSAALVPPTPEVPAQTSHMATNGSISPPQVTPSPGQHLAPLQQQQQQQQQPALGTAFSSNLQISRNVSYTSQMPTVGTATPAVAARELEVDDHAESVAPTTASRVNDIVRESKFHDDILCQLLDAARLNLIGKEAKKALQRAAKERVGQLRTLRDRGELTPDVITLAGSPEGKKPKTRRSKDAKGKRTRHRSVSGDHMSEKAESTVPPPWAQEIIQRLAAFDLRFAELEKHGHEGSQNDDAPSQDFGGNLLEDLLFNEFGGMPLPPDLAGMSALPIHLQAALGFPGASPPFEGSMTPQPNPRIGSAAAAHIETLSPDKTHPSGAVNGELISWGSEVELPHPGERVSPPKTPIAPVINIQAPTESNIERSQRAITPTHGTRTPKANTVISAGRAGVAPDTDVPHAPSTHHQPTQVSDAAHQTLPATVTDSIRSHRASPAAPHNVPLPPSRASASTGHVASPPAHHTATVARTATPPQTVTHTVPAPQSIAHTVAHQSTAYTVPPPQSIAHTVPPPQASRTSVAGTVLPPGVHAPSSFPYRPSEARQSHPAMTHPSGATILGSQYEPPPMPPLVSVHEPIPGPGSAKAPTLMSPPLNGNGTVTQNGGDNNIISPTELDHSQTAYKTAYTAMPRTPPRDRIHVYDAQEEQPMPWDMVTQKLYSWAIVWDEKSFVNALEEICLGRQVDEFALSIFVMMTFKRMLRRNMSDSPPRVCDKLFVPPTMANAINQAVHSKNFKAGQQMFEELWYPFMFKDPPRIIIALARHRNEPDHWTAHRFDLSSGTLRSYSITHDEKQLKDGRPFMWWHAIRLAWPQYKIPDPLTLSQRVEVVHTLPENKDDNSLEALNYARNLFVGYRPEHPSDLTKLRENIWGEVKRLLQKKRTGHLVVDLDSPHHVEDI